MDARKQSARSSASSSQCSISSAPGGSSTDLSPKYAARIDGGVMKRVLVSDIRTGDLVRVAPGERIPVDGTIQGGLSEIDESIATGESLPVTRRPGDDVLGGTINGSGVLEIRATGVGADSFLQQMVALVEEAQGSKPPIQRMADRLSGIFVPVIIFAAALTGLGWHFLAGADLLGSLLPAVAVVLIACPCALGLATPTAVLAASGRAAREGVLVRNGAALGFLEPQIAAAAMASSSIFVVTNSLRLQRRSEVAERREFPRTTVPVREGR